MFRKGVGINQEIIQIYDEELIEKFAEGIVHVVLKGAGGVTETERHYCILEQPIATTEGCLPLLSCGHAQSIVSVPNIEFGKVFRSADAVQQFAD
jgi:hypothetical protein